MSEFKYADRNDELTGSLIAQNYLELVESDLDLICRTRTNRTVNILTAVGLILALVEVLLAVGDAIWSYLLTLPA
jgi:hypothetical protein